MLTNNYYNQGSFKCRIEIQVSKITPKYTAIRRLSPIHVNHTLFNLEWISYFTSVFGFCRVILMLLIELRAVAVFKVLLIKFPFQNFNQFINKTGLRFNRY